MCLSLTWSTNWLCKNKLLIGVFRYLFHLQDGLHSGVAQWARRSLRMHRIQKDAAVSTISLDLAQKPTFTDKGLAHKCP